ncbi:MAG: hypothetical protein LBS56_07655, partial [Propionibacteriaceae bacterium]|nr:hypothetical protein [Propionibacteriaceae bacterium]
EQRSDQRVLGHQEVVSVSGRSKRALAAASADPAGSAPNIALAQRPFNAPPGPEVKAARAERRGA